MVREALVYKQWMQESYLRKRTKRNISVLTATEVDYSPDIAKACEFSFRAGISIWLSKMKSLSFFAWPI